MKKTKKMLAFFTVCALVVTTCVTKIAVKASGETAYKENKVSASQRYVDAMGPGWNLGNTFDGFDTGGDRGEQSWGNPVVTKELFDKIKQQGFRSIRMPFTSVMRTGAAPEYKLDEKFLARYGEVVQWAVDKGLYVMINLHHDSWNWAAAIGADWDNGYSMHRYKAIWAQLADYFKDYSDKVCFESLNEPQFWSGDTARQIQINDEVNAAFYNIVRNSGGKNKTRMLVLPTLNTNDSADRCEALYNAIKGFNDENIIATFHYYGFWPFSTNIAGWTTMDERVVSELEAAFDRVYNQFTAKGIGVICGEYGLLGFDRSLDTIEQGEKLKYFEYINYYAKAKKIAMMLWDNGQHMGRTSLVWSDQALYEIIKASWKSRSSYTESDRLFIKSEDKYKEVQMKLILNGNTLKSVYNGGKKLVLGKDYILENDIITLKGNYVKTIITDNYGINTTLTMKFSAGADWDVFVTHYKTPALGLGTGNTDSFAIPVQFNGSRLSTMEAINANGTGAGPQNWTTFKEYDYAFTVNYADNKVVMTNNFFKEASDGEIILKFHFQSGEILQCKILKAGNIVTAIN